MGPAGGPPPGRRPAASGAPSGPGGPGPPGEGIPCRAGGPSDHGVFGLHPGLPGGGQRGGGIDHINRHSTGHSEAILTQTRAHADLFTKLVDSAAVYVNASTRFTDGGQFGLGCEMGISTQKLHARGPMGLEELTSYKYIILGDGQIR